MEKRPNLRALGYFILAFAALTLVFWALSYDRAVLVMQYYAGPLALVFFGMSLHSGTYSKRSVYWLGIAFVGWFVVSRILNGELYLENSWWHMAGLCVTYLLAFPFAFAMDDAARRRGFAIIAGIFSVSYALLAWLSLIAILSGENIVLPHLGSEFGAMYFRLYANQHPNGSAMLCFIGLMLTLYLVFQYRKRWMLLPAAIMIVGFYLGIALTVSRTVMVELALAVGALAGLFCLGRKLRHSWVRFSLAAVAFLVSVGVVYLSFDLAIDGVSALQSGEWLPSAGAQTVQAAQAAPAVKADAAIKARPIVDNLKNFTGRTAIWEGALELVKAQPKTLLTGLLNSELVSQLKQYSPLQVDHAHDAWLHTLLNMGLPGLLLSIWFTLLAIRSGWRILLRYFDKTTWAEKVMALLALLLLVNCVTECVLFVEMFSYANIVFFLCLGYMLELEKKLVSRDAG